MNARWFSRRGLAVAASLLLSTASPALAAAPALEPSPPIQSLQGAQAPWINDPHTHAFYALAVAAFADGPDHVDKAKFERESIAIFRDFGASMGMTPDAMAEHLKLIPGQVIQIATADPTALSSFDRFVAAIFGPQ